MMDRSMCMRRILFLVLVATMLAVGVVPASAGGASVDRLEGPFDTSVLVGIDPYISGDAVCDWVQRVERPDGSAKETMQCHLTGVFYIWDWNLFEFLPCPDCEMPTRAFVDGPLELGCYGWMSDYWWQLDESVVFAERLRVTVTPSGHVSAKSDYPAEPLVCED